MKNQDGNKKIRFAVIGTSSIAPYHIYCLQNNPDAEAVYIFSRDPKRSRQFAERHGLISASSYEEILHDSTIDAVDIVTEPNRHAGLALAAMQNKKHVLLEKPLDVDIRLAQKVMEEAKNSSTYVSVISKKRFDPILSDIKEKIRGGAIGNPLLAEVKILWKRSKDYYNNGNGWRGREGNVLINQAIHWIDFMLWLFGMPLETYAVIRKINKDLQCYDTASCCFRFPNNFIFNLFCSTAFDRDHPEEFKIYGTKGIFDYASALEKSKPSFFKRLKNQATNFNNPEKLKILDSPLQSQVDNFVEALVSQKPPQVSVIDAYNALKIIKDCEAKAR